MRRRPAILVVGAVLGLTMATLNAPVRAGAADPPGTLRLGGKLCDLVDVPAAAPLGVATSCGGVRPGAVVRSSSGMCSFNFMWRGGDGRTLMGTAGHCILGSEGTEAAWSPGSGPAAFDAAGERVGEFAYAILASPFDFALIRLDIGVEASPQMCHFGGPTGLNTDLPSLFEPVILNQFGQGLLLGSVLPGRTMLALGMPHPDHVFAAGVVLPGDSGSGVISADGRAVGVVVTTGLHLGTVGLDGLDAGSTGITRLAPQVARASAVLGTSLTLQTAPLL